MARREARRRNPNIPGLREPSESAILIHVFGNARNGREIDSSHKKNVRISVARILLRFAYGNTRELNPKYQYAVRRVETDASRVVSFLKSLLVIRSRCYDLIDSVIHEIKTEPRGYALHIVYCVSRILSFHLLPVTSSYFVKTIDMTFVINR